MELEMILAKWGLSVTMISALIVATIATVEILKKSFGVAGKWILLASAFAALAWCILFFYPEWLAAFRSAVFVFIGASGGFQAMKTLAGKIGEDSLKPTGTIDRGPSKPDGK